MKIQREAGMLMPIFSLPSRYGIGDLGPASRDFINFLGTAGQGCWQFLPIHPINAESEFSPYDSPSAFAGNPLFISPDDLVEEGWLQFQDLMPLPDFNPDQIDYPAVIRYKKRLLNRAFQVFQTRGVPEVYERFRYQERHWLEDFAYYTLLEDLKGPDWRTWPEALRTRNREAMTATRNAFESQLERIRFEQFLFFRQWRKMRTWSEHRRIRMIGDLPFYVTLTSADVWRSPRNFHLNEWGKPLYAAGVPPDYFSPTGQLWGNPVYRWSRMRRNGYSWWQRRIAHELSLVDRLRLDHFRGFVASWRVPENASTAEEGHWARGPGRALLGRVIDRFGSESFIAEDLGMITPPVSRLRRELQLPGMTILIFAFGSDTPRHPYLPANHEQNSVAYTGTHDNPTVRAWLEKEADDKTRKRVFRFLGREMDHRNAVQSLVRMVMESRADTVVIPLQDHLGLGEEARINRPARLTGNWRWRVRKESMTSEVADRIAGLTRNSSR